jgi:hypothetical protein
VATEKKLDGPQRRQVAAMAAQVLISVRSKLR